MQPDAHPWAGLATDTELVGGERGERARVAITSYEFVGIVRNGGIGTASTELALALARDGHEVDLFFTGAADDGEEGFERWRRHYGERGLRLVGVPPPGVPDCDSVVHSAAHSLALYRALAERDRERPYDAIHFVESLGHGFYALLAQRLGIDFRRATTVVNTHSPRRWLAEAHGLPFDHPAELSDEFLENRCLELADVLVSPSAHVLEWLRERGVCLPERSYVQQYVTEFDLREATPPAPAPVEELVFFGRLEWRKGILTFCDALDLLAADPPPGLRRVTLLGKESIPLGTLRERGEAWPWELRAHTDFDRDAALAYLHQPGRLAVMASTMDNSPNVVYEAIGLGLAFLASRGGGTGELVHPDDFERVTYDPRDPELREVDPADPARTRAVHSGRVLAERLRAALAEMPRPARYAVPPDANREAHLAWHRAVGGREPGPPPQPLALGEPLAVAELATAGPIGEATVLLDTGVEPAPGLADALARAAAASPEAAFVVPLGEFELEPPGAPGTRTFLPTGGPAALGLVGNVVGAGVALARREALERIGVLGDPERAPLSVADVLTRAALAGERIDVLPGSLFRLTEPVVGHALSRAQPPAELMRPFDLMLPPQARDIAACAAHIYREEPELRHAAVEADHLAGLYADLARSPGVRAVRALRHPSLALRALRRRLGRRRG
jgi:glycosyltransferase involved in cell wall biosynthesis